MCLLLSCMAPTGVASHHVCTTHMHVTSVCMQQETTERGQTESASITVHRVAWRTVRANPDPFTSCTFNYLSGWGAVVCTPIVISISRQINRWFPHYLTTHSVTNYWRHRYADDIDTRYRTSERAADGIVCVTKLRQNAIEQYGLMFAVVARRVCVSCEGHWSECVALWNKTTWF